MNKGSNGTKFSLRVIDVIMALICFVMFFSPLFKVSTTSIFAAEKTESAWGIATYLPGTFFYMFLQLLLPIGIMVIAFLKNIVKEKVFAIVALGCSGLSVLIWIISYIHIRVTLSYRVEPISVTFWFVLMMLLHLSIIAVGILSLVGVISIDVMDAKTISNVISERSRNLDLQIIDALGPSEWTCKCGNVVKGGKFCTKCGSTKPEPVKCPNCGSKISENDLFCLKCGYKIIGGAAPAPAPAPAPQPQVMQPQMQPQQPVQPQMQQPVQPAGLTCPTCGAPVKPGFAFCQKCGTKVQ